MSDATIVTTGLTKSYGDTTVVDGLDLVIQAGEVFGLLGPNGAGKTTTILMLLGLVNPTAGSVRILGLDPVREAIDVKRRVGYLPDAVGFYDTMSGRQNLRFTAHLNGLDEVAAEEQIEAALTEVGLRTAADQLVGKYSRGMLQRLGIADALIKSPSVLILDEPTTAIDPEGVAEILTLIRRLAERGVTVLLSSHLLHQVQAVCDRVAIFISGRIVAAGTPGELAASRSGPETIEVGVDGETDVARVLTGVSFVEQVDAGRYPGMWDVTVTRGSTPDLVRLLAASDTRISSLRRVTDDLEEIYRSYFRRAEVNASA